MNIHEQTLYLNPGEVGAYGMTSPVQNTPVALRDVAENAPWCPWQRWQELTEYIRQDIEVLSGYDAWPRGLAALFYVTDADSRALARHEEQREIVFAIANTVMIHEIEDCLGIPHDL